MLWYKAWLETRSRFLFSLIGIVGLCSFNVFYGDRGALSYSKSEYYYRVLGAGHVFLALMWVIAVTLLMMGGLLRERASGVSSFTLALPVSRMRLMLVRIGMGLMQSIVLVIVPWSVMFLIAATVGKTHSFSQAAFYIALLLGGGSLYFAIALLISSLVEGEYTAPIVSYGIALALLIVFDGDKLRSYDPWRFIVGWLYLDRHTALLAGPIPWLHIAVTLLIALPMMTISIRTIQRRDF